MPVLMNLKGTNVSGRLNQSFYRCRIDCILPQHGPVTKLSFLCAIGTYDPLTPWISVLQNLRPHFPGSARDRKNMNAFPLSFIQSMQKTRRKRFMILLQSGTIKIHCDQLYFSKHIQSEFTTMLMQINETLSLNHYENRPR